MLRKNNRADSTRQPCLTPCHQPLTRASGTHLANHALPARTTYNFPASLGSNEEGDNSFDPCYCTNPHLLQTILTLCCAAYGYFFFPPALLPLKPPRIFTGFCFSSSTSALNLNLNFSFAPQCLHVTRLCVFHLRHTGL